MATDPTKLEYREHWTGKYRGIPFEVSSYTPSYSFGETHPIWTFYIFLRIEAIPAEHRSKFFIERDMTKPHYARYDWSKCALNDLREWHLGMTFYSVEADGECVKAGCDYNHYWDEGKWHGYNETFVAMEARALIDELHAKHPYLLVRCNYNGRYFPPDQMTAWGDGYISPEGIIERDTAAAARAAEVPHA